MINKNKQKKMDKKQRKRENVPPLTVCMQYSTVAGTRQSSDYS